MSLNYVLLWMTIPGLVLSIRHLARSDGQGAEILLCVFTLVVTGILLAVAPGVAGYVSLALLVVFFLLPGLLIRSTNLCIQQHNFAEARKRAGWLCWIRPTPAVRAFPRMLEALDLGQRGEFQAAADLLAPFRSLRTTTARNATANLFRMQGNWEGLLEWIKTEEIVTQRQPYILILQLRALGETGDLNSLAQYSQHWQARLERIPHGLQTAQLFLFAFAGQTDSLRKLCEGNARLYPQPIKEFWLATAEMAAGNFEQGKNRLLAIKTEDRLIQLAGQGRLAQPPRLAAEIMSPETKKIIAEVEQHIVDQARYNPPGVKLQRRAYATYALILINAVVFVYEALNGGIENAEALYRMGGLYPSAVLEGEWWRIVASCFLHVNLLHLSMNLFALFLLGPFAEATLGIGKYLAVYLGSGCGSMLIIVVVAKMGWMQEEMVVGASGAIMGIVGATGAILLLARQSKVAARRLRSIVFIIALQVVFDQATPNISAMGHAGGVFVGFVIGLLLAPKPAARN